MNVVKRKKNKDFTIISNVFLRDKNLSIKSKGFLAVVMGLPDDWDFSINGILEILKEGKTSIYNSINELKENGYCMVETCRDELGRIVGNDYTFSDIPFSQQPYLENPNMDNQPQLNTKEIKYLKDNKEDIDKSISKKKENVDVDIDAIVNMWNGLQVTMPKISKVTKITDMRKRKIKNLLKSCSTTSDELLRFISTLPYADDWVIGKGNNTWVISFDWLINNTGNWFVRGLEGEMHKKNIIQFRDIMDGRGLMNGVPSSSFVKINDGERNDKGEIWSEQLHRWLK